MAQFNPNVPDMQDPNYLGYSKGVPAPEASVTKGLALKTAGDAIKGVAEVADNWIKKDIDKDIYTAVDKERDQYTSSLETIKDQMQQGLIPGASQPTLVSPSPQAGDNIPTNLQSSLQQAEILSAARAGGKINDTYYSQRLSTIQQQIRSEYPGYRDYIDQKISQVSGMNPANAYYKNLMQDINALQTSKKSVSDKITEKLLSASDLPDQDKMWKARQEGLLSDQDAVKFMNDGYALKTKYDRLQMNRTIKKQDREDTNQTATDHFTSEAEALVTNNFSNVFGIMGLGTPENALKILHDADSGKVKITDDQKNGILAALRGARGQMLLELQKTSQDRGYTPYIGLPGRDTIIKSALSRYDDAIDQITNNQYGSLFESKRTADAIQSEGNLGLLKSKMGSYLVLGKAFQDQGGQLWTGVFNRKMIESGVTGEIGTYLSNDLGKNSQIRPDLRQPGAAQSLYENFETMKKVGVKPKTKAYDEGINLMKFVINNQDAPDVNKIEAAKYTFNPSNYKLLDLFNKDYFDPQTKQSIPGKYSVFNKLLSPENTESIYKLGQKDPEVWEMYKNWGNNSFRKLFQQELLDMNSYRTEANTRRGQVHVSYNAQTHQFSLYDDNLREVPLDPRVNTMDSSIVHLNFGLRQMARMYSKDSSDLNAYLLTSGLDPTKVSPGLGTSLMESIRLANQRKSK